MDDERLLSEALRAHAAGGVSSPGTPNAPAAPPDRAEEPAGSGSRLRDRFRPLGRKRGETADPAPETVAHPTPSAQPSAQPAPGPYPAPPRGGPPMARPAPRPGANDRPWQQGAPPPGGRPGPLPTGPVPRPPGPGVPHPRPAPGATGAGPSVPPPTPGEADGPAPWTPARIAWWSGVALLGGAIAGALAAVGTLGLPG
ncbi:hypothetical protein [Actinomycetospora flava]|uniref:Translation initiation factor IF-2 n=1 Tax=Actinomycetospora flava TaxID=3129232 RepID=A0ABU8M5Q9_9PSEU